MMILMSHHGLKGEDYRKLRVLVTFCVNGYFKLFFDIKVKHNHTFGPQHVVSSLQMLKKSKHQKLGTSSRIQSSGGHIMHTVKIY